MLLLDQATTGIHARNMRTSPTDFLLSLLLISGIALIISEQKLSMV